MRDTYESNFIFPRRMLFYHANRSALLVRGLIFTILGLIGLFRPVGSLAAVTVILVISGFTLSRAFPVTRIVLIFYAPFPAHSRFLYGSVITALKRTRNSLRSPDSFIKLTTVYDPEEGENVAEKKPDLKKDPAEDGCFTGFSDSRCSFSPRSAPYCPCRAGPAPR